VIIDLIRKAPSEFPEPEARKKRKLAELPVAPTPVTVEGPSKADLKAQKKRDRQTLNALKLYIQKVMDQIKLKYKKFRTPIVDEGTIAYLFDDQDPQTLSTDLNEEQRRQQALFRPYEIGQDEKGVAGLREIASGNFYYNLDIVVIEKRLSNGYYKRPKDFLADIKRLAKDAKMSKDQDRTLKANEMLANVEVDMADLEQQQPALCAECEAVYQREQERERKLVERTEEARRRGEDVPKITPNVPPAQGSKTTETDSGPVVLGQEVPGRQMFPPVTHSQLEDHSWATTEPNGSHPTEKTNGSNAPSKEPGDLEMFDNPADVQEAAGPMSQFSELRKRSGDQSQGFQSQSQRQGPFSQQSAHTRLAPGSQAEQYRNSASTTTSGHKTSDRSSGGSSGNTHHSEGFRPVERPDFAGLAPQDGDHIPDTQDPSTASQPNSTSSGSQPSQSSQLMGPPRQAKRASSLSAILNTDEEQDQAAHRARHQIILDEDKLQDLQRKLVDSSSGLSLEQLEQVKAGLMDVIWKDRGNWNRNQVWHKVQQSFNETIDDIQTYQDVLDPSQRITVGINH